MIRRKILYILILAACCWIVMLYTFQELRFMLLLLLCVPVICRLLLVPKRQKTEVKISGIPDYMTRGERIRLRVTVTYKGRLPLAGLGIRGTWRAYGEKPMRIENMMHGLSGRTEREIEFELPAKHCGPAELTVAKAKIYDCLRLFSVSVAGKMVRKILITPRLSPVSDNEAALFISLLRIHSASDDGDYFIRDYRPGDSPRSIHWKLTAKEDELQVKDVEPDRQVNLFLNITDRLLENHGRKDIFMDKACSLMAFLAEVCGDRAVVCWMQDGMLCRNRIREPEDVYPCIRRLISVERTGITDPQSETVRGMLEGCHLEEDGRLYLGERCVDEE